MSEKNDLLKVFAGVVVLIALFSVAQSGSSAGNVIFQTTLDSFSSVQSPVVGTGFGAQQNGISYVAGQTGQAADFDSAGDYIRVAQTDGTTDNINLGTGTVEFWFRSDFDSSYNFHRDIMFSSGAWGSLGNFIIGKHNGANNNRCFVLARDTSSQSREYHFDCSWVAGQWTKIRVAWDWTVTPNVVRFWQDDTELFPTAMFGNTNAFSPPQPSTSNHVYIGARTVGSPDDCDCTIDELTIWDGVVVPSGQVDSVPPSVSVASPLNGATVSGVINIDANASDNVAVQNVEFFVDGVSAGVDSTSPYSISWDTTTVSDGSHSLTAVAKDTSNNSATSSLIGVTVDNSVPWQVGPPLTDLVAPLYKGFDRGLYPGWSNTTPSSHASRAPMVSGTIGLVSIGMSNTEDHFCGISEHNGPIGPQNCDLNSFVGVVDGDSDVNSNVFTIDGAQPGEDAIRWDSPTDNAYNVVDSELNKFGLNPNDVQVAWLLQANKQPSVALPNSNADSYELLERTGDILRAAKVRYPNLKQVYISSRMWSCTTIGLSPEPYAYEYGYSVKWLIEAQINQLNGGGVDPLAGNLDLSVAPWIAWGPYIWADDGNPNPDGLSYLASDLQIDCTHPGTGAIAKTAPRLLNFFKTDPIASQWFIAVPDTTPPTVSITLPTGGSTVSGAISVDANASDNVAVDSVEFFVNGSSIGTDSTSPYSVLWDTASVSDGSYGLTAEATDTSGNSALSAVVNVTVDNTVPDTTPPTVSITSPLNGATVSGTISIDASASDDVAVSSVEFFVGGSSIGTDTITPYSISWNTTAVPDGSHSLTAEATDTSSNSATSAVVNVTVDNVAPPTGTLFQTTLDSFSSVQSPVIGTGFGAQQNSISYVAGQTGQAADFDSAGDYIRVAQTDGTTDNINLDTGTVEFWFRSDFDSSFSQYRPIMFASGAWGSLGNFIIGKHFGGANNNQCFILARDTSSKSREYHFNCSWVAGQWTKIRVAWDWTASPNVIRFWQDDTELFPTVMFGNTSAFSPPQPSTSNHVYIGSRTAGGPDDCDCTIDELTIWDGVVVP